MKIPWLALLNAFVFVLTPFVFPTLQSFAQETLDVTLSYQGLALVYMLFYVAVLVVDIIRAVRANIDLSIRGIVYVWVAAAIWFFGLGIWSCLNLLDLPDELGGFGRMPPLIIIFGKRADVANLLAISIAGVQARTREIDNTPS